MRVCPLLVVTFKERAWPFRYELLCQFWPQFLDMACQLVLEPFIETLTTSPAPPTLVISTRLKYECPLIVNLTPPVFLHGTLHTYNFTVRSRIRTRLIYAHIFWVYTEMGQSGPSILNRDYSSFVLSNVLKDRLRKIKVMLRRVAPASSIIRQGIIWWAKISSSDKNWTRQAPLVVIYTFDLKAGSTAQPAVEKSSTQCSSICSIPLTVKIPIPTSPTCKKGPWPN